MSQSNKTYWEAVTLPKLLESNSRIDLSFDLQCAINNAKEQLRELEREYKENISLKKKHIKMLEHRLRVVKGIA